MRVDTITKFLIGIIFLCSCKTENEKTFPVIVKEYSLSKLHKTDSTTLTIRKKDSISTLLFGLKEHGEHEILTDFYVELNHNDSTRILIDNKPAKLISEKEYSDRNKSTIVKKYYYDIENENNEEGFFFIANNRLISFNSTAWNLKKFYKYENSNWGELLKKDTTDFYYRYLEERILN